MISEELKTQAERYQRSRSFALNDRLKADLSVWYTQHKAAKLNTGCSTCIRNAMRDLCHYIQDLKANEEKPAKIQFIGVKQYNYDALSYNQLKAAAKEKGLDLGQAPKKSELLIALKSLP